MLIFYTFTLVTIKERHIIMDWVKESVVMVADNRSIQAIFQVKMSIHVREMDKIETT